MVCIMWFCLFFLPAVFYVCGPTANSFKWLRIFYSKDNDDDSDMEESKTDNEQKAWNNFKIKAKFLSENIIVININV